MSNARDVVVIGAGHNGLVTAAALARAGRSVLVLEARANVGGRAVTEEIHPGFRCPTVVHGAGPVLPRIATDLRLEQHGLEWLRPDVRVLAPSLVGPALAIHDDAARTADGLRAIDAKDAERYPQFAASIARIGAAVAPLLSITPPAVDTPSGRDLWNLMRLGLRVRGLGKKDAYRLFRWGPMAVADLAAEWFESDLLRATIAARGIHACFAGPWSAGTSAGVILQAALDGHATAPAAFPKGGLGALTGALATAARSFGAEIRTSARVERILLKDRVAAGVVLESGEQIEAHAVVSNADPRRTYLALVDAAALGPEFVGKLRNYRCQGSAAKVNLALSRLPKLAGASSPAMLGGRIHIGPSIDDLERAFDAAKYGDVSPRPYLDIAIPSVLDPTLAPPGAHVMSIHAQFAPYAVRGGWTARKDELTKAVLDTLSDYAPDLRETIVATQVLTPVDLEAEYGLTGGHLWHGEPALDQLFTFRPLIGWARYRSPIARLYLCGSGTHPGGVVCGASGANASREILRDLRS
jgi:phytoene dehydrogenase-like protein